MKGYMSITAFLGAIFISILSGFHAKQEALATRSIHGAPCMVQNNSCKAIVFDLGGVLIETSKRGTIWQVGMQNIFRYWRHNKSDEPDLRTRVYETLHSITETDGNTWHVKDEEGIELPQLVAEWLLGTRPNQEILKQALEWIEKNPKWFSSHSEKKVIKKTIEIMFNPKKFVRTRKIVSETAHLIKECKERGFKLYALSNWDAESSKLLLEKYSDIFDLFDGIIFSGDVHHAKPATEMFTSITKIIPANQCTFIDDQPENITAAKQLGFNTILVNSTKKLLGKKPNIQEVREQLRKIEIISD